LSSRRKDDIAVTAKFSSASQSGNVRAEGGLGKKQRAERS
jgi:hypothetical protein